MSRNTRVLVADDHGVVRKGLRFLLQIDPGIEVVGEASDGREAVRMTEELSPDVVVMDITMPGMNGFEAALRLKKDHPQIKIIILSMHASEEYVLQALRAGASGYLVKDSAPLELALALQSVARGETYLSPPISRQVVDSYMQRVGQGPGDEPLALLTGRQREILQLIAEGSSTKDIARKLDLSVKTVETHRAQLMERLDIHDVAGLVRFAVRHGLVGTDK